MYYLGMCTCCVQTLIVLHPLKIYTMSHVSRFNYMNIIDVTPKNFNKRKRKSPLVFLLSGKLQVSVKHLQVPTYMSLNFSTKETCTKALANVPTSILALLGWAHFAPSQHHTIYMIMIQWMDHISVIL